MTSRSVHGDGLALGNPLLVAQHGQVALLAVRESISLCHEPAGKEGRFRRCHTEGGDGLLAGTHLERQLLGVMDFLGLRVKQLHAHHALDHPCRTVLDGCRESRLIAHTGEARQLCLEHELLARHDLVFQLTIPHVLRMRLGKETPGRQALGQGEGKGCHAVLVGADVRIEECGLGKVGARSLGRCTRLRT